MCLARGGTVGIVVLGLICYYPREQDAAATYRRGVTPVPIGKPGAGPAILRNGVAWTTTGK